MRNDTGDRQKGGTVFPLWKQYSVWLRLLAKRLWRQPAFVGLLALIPILGYAVSVMEQGERGAVAAVCVEDGPWAEQIVEGMERQEQDSVLRYVFCTDAARTVRLVLRGEADCGFVLPADLAERVMEKDWRKCVTVYETPSSSITGIAKERIAQVVFQQYSEQRYAEYMETVSPEIAEFAMDAYETHLTDASTFRFRYLYDDRSSQQTDDAADINDMAVFPVKGVFAVIIFIGGMCGMLEYDRDIQEKRFLRMAPNILTYIVDIWLPTLFISVAVLICLWLSDGVRMTDGDLSLGGLLGVWGVRVWAREFGRLAAYQLIVVLYCLALGAFLRRRETMAAAIPLLSLGCLVCSPVFVRLAAYAPVFAVLEKLFPATYYLRM